MSSDIKFSVSSEVIDFIKDLIAKYSWEPVSDIKYCPGSEPGDGYACKHVAVEVIRPAGNIKLFVKYTIDYKDSKNSVLNKFYENEPFFYNIVYPAYTKFISDRNVQNGFKEAPKCYGTSTKHTIVLENLRYKGFTLHDRKKVMDQKHIDLVLRALAKFHATSFAFKDQDREMYQILVDKCAGDFYSQQPKDSPSARLLFEIIQEGLDKLDPAKDKDILDRCDAQTLMDAIYSLSANHDEYSIISQGDCHSNNVMFQYEDENRTNPKDVMLVDWQVLRSSSPVYDLCYFFYALASEESLNNLDSHLKVYYTELSGQIKQLGSDPETLYPEEVFRSQWKRYSLYGLATSFFQLKFMLAKPDEVPRMDNVYSKNIRDGEKMGVFEKYDNQEEYMSRLRRLGHFMVDNDYI
ncbi:hypothetical protein Trydic_g19648 [Trypoxylus dichotomus]